MKLLEIEMPHWPTASWAELDGEPLERMERLLEAMDNPHQKMPPVVHVAGTNGKGSTIAFIRAILEAAGYKVHAYTSPHIKKFSERIVLASQPVEESALHLALELTRLANEEQPIGFFEGTTAAAFHLFATHPADIVLIETGMGGRDDPTNILEPEAVRLCIITPISADHMEYLGDDLEQIAEHKAGIIKTQTPVIVGFQTPEISEQLEKYAEKTDSPALIYGKHFAVQKAVEGFIYADGHGQIPLPEPSLKGPHQYLNAGCAIAALSVLEEFEVMGDHIAAGLKWAQWPGRLEQMDCEANNVPKSWQIWFDGGHNMAAGHMLAVVAQEEWNDAPLYIIFGTTRGKDVAAMLAPLAQQAEEIIVVPVAIEPKCYTPMEMMDQLDDAQINAMQAESVAQAIAEITSREVTKDGATARILVFGSLYLRLELDS